MVMRQVETSHFTTQMTLFFPLPYSGILVLLVNTFMKFNIIMRKILKCNLNHKPILWFLTIVNVVEGEVL